MYIYYMTADWCHLWWFTSWSFGYVVLERPVMVPSASFRYWRHTQDICVI